MNKICFSCGREKPLDSFYHHPQMADGRLGKCKDCCKKAAVKNYRKNVEHYAEYERNRSQLPHRKEAARKYAESHPKAVAAAKRRWVEKNKNKKIAEYTVTNAVRDGRLVKMPCICCGSTTRVHGHHEDYTKPLEVMWLCPKHHSILHFAKRVLKF